MCIRDSRDPAEMLKVLLAKLKASAHSLGDGLEARTSRPRCGWRSNSSAPRAAPRDGLADDRLVLVGGYTAGVALA